MMRNPAFLLGALFFCLYALMASGHVYSIDEISNTMTAVSLATRGSFEIEPVSLGITPAVGKTGRGGRFYSKYSPLMPVLMAPAAGAGVVLAKFAPAGFPKDVSVQFVCGFVNSAVTAAAVVVVYLLGCALGAGRRGAFAGAAVFGLCTIAAPYSKTSFTEPVAGLAVALCFLMLVRGADGGGRGYLLRAAVCAGLVPLARLSSAPLLLPLFIYAWVRIGRRGALVFGAGAAAGVLLYGLFNFWRFGNFLETGYGAEAMMANKYPLAALYGLLISSDKSVFVYSPPLVVAFWGLWKLRAKGGGAEALCILCVFAVGVLFFASHHDWAGGHCWGPRFLVPVVPLCMGASAVVFDGFRGMGRGGKGAVVCVVALGAAVQVCAVSVKFNPNYSNDMVTYDIERAYIRGRLLRPGAPRFVPLRDQAVDTVEHYGYTLRHVGEYFGGGGGGGFDAAENSKLVEFAPDMWLFLVVASAGGAAGAGAGAVALALAGAGLFFFVRLRSVAALSGG